MFKPVIKLVDYNQKSKSWSPQDMLQDLVNDPYSNRFKKAIIVFLDDADGDYDTRIASAGMDRRDIVSLLETVKLKYLRKLAGDENA